MIYFYKHSEINKEKWNRCVKQSVASTIFVDFDFLEIACPEWCALVRDDYDAVMPLPWRSKCGIDYVYSPAFYFRLGIFSPSTLSADQVAEFVAHIPSRFVQVDLNLNERNSDSQIRGKVDSQISHELNLNASYETLFQQFSRSHKHNIKVARKALLVLDRSICVEDVISLFRNNRGKDKHIKISDLDYGFFLQMTEFAAHRDLLECWGVRDTDGFLLAGACFLRDEKHLWFWFSGRDESRSESRAMFFLLDEYIRTHSASPFVLGLSGSKNENVSQLYRGFGAQRYTYPMLHFSNNAIAALPVRIYKFLKEIIK